jgi:hypothetical protein
LLLVRVVGRARLLTLALATRERFAHGIRY